ncbi:MAG: CpcT/CpeT family chromophore lyase [Pseudomonadota bacterium]
MTLPRPVYVSAVSLALLAACTAPPEIPPAAETPDGASPALAEIDIVLDQMSGAFDNAAQYAAADETLKRPPAPGHPYDWIDQQTASFHTVEAPLIGDHVVYLEWRSGGPDGPISRQRIWSFNADKDGAITGMDFYTFQAPDPFAGLGAAPGAFEALSLDDLIGYPEGCTLGVERPEARAWVFSLNPDTCQITARSGRVMRIEARIGLSSEDIGTVVEYAEAGVLEGGDYAFKVPGGPAYRFMRR